MREIFTEFTKEVPGQPRIHRETLSQKKPQTFTHLIHVDTAHEKYQLLNSWLSLIANSLV